MPSLQPEAAAGPAAGRKPLLVLAAAVAIGAVDGLLFIGFEWVVNHGLDWIWNDLVDSDDVRWRVVPLALVLSVLYAVALRVLREPRLVEPHVDPLSGADDADPEAGPPPATFGSIATITLVGLASLLAGAALGPEAPLVGATSAIGAWAAMRVAPGPDGKLLVLASVGALLVVFFGSPVAVAIPLLVLVQRTKRLAIPAVAIIVLCGMTAYGVLWAVAGDAEGFGGIPGDAAVHAHDYATALVLGVVCVPIGLLLRRLVPVCWRTARRVGDRVPWWLAAAAFGAVLGALYLAGGESVQFSGSEGIGILVSRAPDYGWLALAGILLAKIAVAAWSLGAGYRGGLVFPSVFCGVALGLLVASIAGDVAGPGIIIGAVGGILAEMTLPLLAVIMLFALLPLEFAGLGVAAAAGVLIGRQIADRVGPASTDGS